MKHFVGITSVSLFCVVSLCLASQAARAIEIIPQFDSSITSQPAASAIETDIDYTASVMDRLYTNQIAIPIDFQFKPLPAQEAAQSNTYLSFTSYSNYKSALLADSGANPKNATLATAVANLSKGNGANGSKQMVLTQSQAMMLEQYGLSGPSSLLGPNTITLSSTESWTFAGPVFACAGECGPIETSVSVPSGTVDADQALFHELNEILGGGGQGSTLNGCLSRGGQWCNEYGSLDLYRYSAPGVPSYTTASGAQAYMSFDGGETDAIGGGFDFLSAPMGDAADFNDAPAPTYECPTPELIQGYTCPGIIPESYDFSSPEFAMLSAIGWDNGPCVGRDCPVMRGPPPQDPINGVTQPNAVPEPSTFWLLIAGLTVLLVCESMPMRTHDEFFERKE